MTNIVEVLVSTLVPILVQEAEALLGVTPNPNDNSWVAALIQEMVGLIQKYIPAWMAPSVQDIEQLVAAEIEKVLAITESKKAEK